MDGVDETRRIVLPASAPPRRWPHLIVLEGEGVGQVFRLVRPETIIGRSPGADIYIDSDTISRRHARLTLVGDQVTVEDLGSRNGTYVEMDQVKGPCVLHDGAHLAIGTSTLLKLTHAVALDAAIRKAGFELASRDPATLAANTSYFVDRLRGEHAYAVRHREPLILVFLRVDGIGSGVGEEAETPEINDVMRSVARVLRSSLRAEDLLARSGSDLFVTLVRSTGQKGMDMAERMRSQVSQSMEGRKAGQPVTLTAVVVPLGASGPAAAETVLVSATEAAQGILRRSADRAVLMPTLATELVPGDGTPS